MSLFYVQDYTFQWFSFSLLLAVWLIWFTVSREVGRLAATLLSWVVVSSLNVWLNPNSRYQELNAYDLMALRLFTTDALAKLMLVLTAMLCAARNKENFEKKGSALVAWYCLLDALFGVYQFLFTTHFCKEENTCGSFVGNPSMNTCFLVVLLPIAMKHFNNTLRGLTLLAVMIVVLVSKSSLGFGMLALAGIVWAVLESGSILTMAYMALGVPALMGIGHLLLGSELTNSGDRLKMWEFFLSKWNVPHNWILGTGYGTFGVFSINLQKFFHVGENGWWIWIHNDWLQSLMELGVPGVLLMICTYGVALSKLFLEGRRTATTSLVLLGAMMFFNYPGHLAPTALFACWLMVLALKKDPLYNRER